jgi:hypothetical protein
MILGCGAEASPAGQEFSLVAKVCVAKVCVAFGEGLRETRLP